MVNGNVAKTTNIGIIVLCVICLIGVIYLSGSGKDTPAEIGMVLASCIGFLVGTKFTPLDNYTEKRPSDVHPNDKVVVNEKETK